MPQRAKHCRSDLLMLCHRQTLQIRLAHVMPQGAKHCRSDLLMLCHKHCRSDLLMLCHKQTNIADQTYSCYATNKHCRSDLFMLCHKQTNIADQTCSCYATKRQTLQIRLAHVMPQKDKHCRSDLLMLCHKQTNIADQTCSCYASNRQTLQIRLAHVMPQTDKHCRSDLLMLCLKQTNIADQTCSCYATNRQTLQIRLAHVMPQTDKHCRSVLLPHPLTINCHQARLPYSGQPLLCQCVTDVAQPVRKRHTAHTCGKCSDHLTIKEAIGSYRLTQVSICVYSVACMMFFVLLVQRQLSTGIPWWWWWCVEYWLTHVGIYAQSVTWIMFFVWLGQTGLGIAGVTKVIWSECVLNVDWFKLISLCRVLPGSCSLCGWFRRDWAFSASSATGVCAHRACMQTPMRRMAVAKRLRIWPTLLQLNQLLSLPQNEGLQPQPFI